MDTQLQTRDRRLGVRGRRACRRRRCRHDLDEQKNPRQRSPHDMADHFADGSIRYLPCASGQLLNTLVADPDSEATFPRSAVRPAPRGQRSASWLVSPSVLSGWRRESCVNVARISEDSSTTAAVGAGKSPRPWSVVKSELFPASVCAPDATTPPAPEAIGCVVLPFARTSDDELLLPVGVAVVVEPPAPPRKFSDTVEPGFGA